MLSLLSNIFGYFVKRRNNKFDRGLIPIYKAKIPVISIGNLSAGGTGKTPFTMYLAKLLIDNGVQPAIISRGYKSNKTDGVIVCDNNSIIADSDSAGDEMIMLANNLHIPIVTHCKKYLAAQIVEKNFNVDCILVDDGFQHRFLHRDIDIVLIDNETINKPFLIPKGRLRETFSALKRADIVVINENIKDYSILDKYILNKLVVRNINKAVGFYSVENNSEFKIDKSIKITAFSGIAKNQNFNNSLAEYDVNISKHFCFSDHHKYCDSEINSIIDYSVKNKINTIITTEKDAVKMCKHLFKFKDNNLDLIYLKLDTFVTNNSNLLLSILLNTIVEHNSEIK